MCAFSPTFRNRDEHINKGSVDKLNKLNCRHSHSQFPWKLELGSLLKHKTIKCIERDDENF